MNGTDLQTGRLLLRELREADRDKLFALRSNPEVERYSPDGPLTLERAESLIRQAISDSGSAPRTRYALAVVLRESGEFIGCCRLDVTDADSGTAVIGYGAMPGHWGQGFATEAATELLRFGFEDLGLTRISGDCHPDHRASVRVMERLGMRFECVMPRRHWVRGEWWDMLLYSISRDEWMAVPGLKARGYSWKRR